MIIRSWLSWSHYFSSHFCIRLPLSPGRSPDRKPCLARCRPLSASLWHSSSEATLGDCKQSLSLIGFQPISIGAPPLEGIVAVYISPERSCCFQGALGFLIRWHCTGKTFRAWKNRRICKFSKNKKLLFAKMQTVFLAISSYLEKRSFQNRIPLL